MDLGNAERFGAGAAPGEINAGEINAGEMKAGGVKAGGAKAGRSAVERAFELLPTALLVFDAALGVVACNRAAQRMLGLGETPPAPDRPAADRPAPDRLEVWATGARVEDLLAASRRFDVVDQRLLAEAIRALLTGGAQTGGAQTGGARSRVACSQGRALRLTATEANDVSSDGRSEAGGEARGGGWIVGLLLEAADARAPGSGAPGSGAPGSGAPGSAFDDLTGLPNRAAFREYVSDAEIESRMDGRGATLLCLDLDRFRQVNDTLGHAVGDALLARAAERMRKAVRSEDLVGRLGGDEFAVLTTKTDAGAIEALAARLIDLVSRPYLIDGHLVTVGVSIGAAMMPGDADTADGLAKCADLALYRAKGDGRGVPRRYHPEMSEQAGARRLLEIDLRKALLLGEFELDYQPQMDIDGVRILGFEALLRWNHPTRGRVSPAEFVPLAEETGQIIAIGEWVLRTAAAEAAGWPADVSIAVNLSPTQFRTGKLVATVAAALARTGLDPARLELEITEGVLLSDEQANLTVLGQLHDLGVKVAIDDFGTGYASLSYLKRFAFDKIKIDQSFVREMIGNAESDAIVRAVIHLGAMLGMTTIAEGVETAAELERVRAHGCGAVQGYLTGRPMSRADARGLLAGRTAQALKRA